MTSFNHVIILTRGNWFQTNPLDYELHHADLLCVFYNGEDMVLQLQI